MPYILALASAVLYGSADFIGGLTSRRANAVAAVLVSQLAGLLLLLLLTPLLPSSSPTAADLLWGGIAGMAGGIGVALLYQALAVGTMAIVAPVTAVCAVAIPVMAGIAFGERPPAAASAGIAIAVASIVLVSRSPQEGAADLASSRGVPLALMSGVAIGLFFLALARTGSGAGAWPLVSARATSVTFFAAFALARHVPVRMPGRVTALISTGGALDMLANLLYLVATRGGPLSIVVTLASLYPASTVVLARVILGERMGRVQAVGIAFAFLAVVLIVSST